MRRWGQIGGMLALALLLGRAGPASAQAGLRVYEIESVRVDGAAREWRGAELTQVGSGADASLRFALAHAGDSLFFVAHVEDERLVRTRRPGAREDAVILTFASPDRDGAIDVYLFAGVSGQAASAASGPVGGSALRPLRGARVVEGPAARGTGYTLEAELPLSALPGGRAGWETLRASVRLRDVDSEARPTVEAEPAFVPVDRARLDQLAPLRPMGGATGALEQFLASRGLGAATPTFDLRGNVVGDAAPERVFLVSRFIVVSGPGVRGGGYGYHELPIEQPRDVRSAELRDLTGDGVEELVLVLRQRNPQGERDLWQVFTLEDPIRATFAIEVRKAIGAGSVEARVRVLPGRRGQPPEIEVEAHRAEGLDASSYREREADDAQAMLLPWGPVRSRRYRWSGRGFEPTSERANPRYREPEAAPSTPVAAPTPAPAPTPEALLTAFRQEHGIPRGARPRWQLSSNLAGDRAAEMAHVYGRKVVVVGPGIAEGRSFFFYEVPVGDDADLLDASAADVTGDGRAELLFRVRQRFGDVSRELLLVHTLTAQGFPQILQLEVARERGAERVQNEVSTRGGRLEVRPGRAVGFSATRWPFTRDPSDSAQPLLLPWEGTAPVRYRFDGRRLAR